VSDILQILRENPSSFEATTGLSPKMVEKLTQTKNLVSKTKQIGIDAQIFTKNTKNSEVIETLADLTDNGALETALPPEMLKAIQDGNEVALRKMAATKPSKRILDSIDEQGNVKKPDTTDWASNELFDSSMANKWFSSLSKKAEEPGNYAAKLGDALFNKMPDQYGALDYRYKLGTVKYATTAGLKEGELRIAQRLVGLTAEDITPVMVDGVQRYKIGSHKALQLANEAFLNYNAMPAIVKVLRNLPLVGAPFAAFTYGMYAKTGRTALTNPAFFNKTNFALSEARGDDTPIEKGLLNMDRYEYLNDPAMMKLPMGGNNMTFINLANMLPYYSLNMFQPPQRKYEDTLTNDAIQIMDRLPVMQDPVGNVIFDFLLMPLILKDELPQGAFGQPIHPKDAGAGTKALYAARSLADPFMPGITQPFVGMAAGLGENAGILPEGTTQLLPGYRTRSMGEAVQGATSVGVQSKESAPSRSLRNFFASGGIPIQSPVPYSYLQEDEALRNNNK
ncbi:hypothetical protein KAU11_07950, partial [Candidatus Babeliales bacterium]|nr:hypothetical protein [Candidatus Babeliales bacterium]